MFRHIWRIVYNILSFFCRDRFRICPGRRGLVFEIPIAFLSARIRQLRRRCRRRPKQKHCENGILKSKYLQKALKKDWFEKFELFSNTLYLATAVACTSMAACSWVHHAAAVSSARQRLSMGKQEKKPPRASLILTKLVLYCATRWAI
jgi:hypothetical protein